MPRAGLPLTPPNPIVDVAAHFFLGALLGPAAITVSAVCLVIYTLYNVTGTGSSNLTSSVSDVISEGVGYVLPCIFLGTTTYLLLKTRSGRPLPFAIGVFASSAAWGFIVYVDEKDSALLIRHVVGGMVLAGAGYGGAKLGLAAHAKRFRPGLGNACAHCRYDLSATPEGQVCPECGGTMRYERSPPT